MTVTATVGFVAYCQHQDGEREQAKIGLENRANKAEDNKRSAMAPDVRERYDKAVVDIKIREKERAAAAEVHFQRALMLVKAIKTSMHDPSSLDIEDAFYTDEGAIAIKYRGKNAFGATIINYAVLTKDGKVATGSQEKVAGLWNKHIAKKGGTDLTSSVRGAKSLGVY